KLPVRRGEIDQIRRVREDGRDAALLGEERAVVIGQLFALPLVRVLREKSDRRCVDRRCALEHRVHAALRRDVSTEEIAVLCGVVEAGNWTRLTTHGLRRKFTVTV